MKQKSNSRIDKQRVSLLLESSSNSIPFNVALAFILSVLFAYQHIPLKIIIYWFVGIFCLSCSRMLICKQFLKKIKDNSDYKTNLIVFQLLTLFIGGWWGQAYFLMFSYTSELQELIILLVFGGIAAGAVTSLAADIISYEVFVLPILLPVTVYNALVLVPERMAIALIFFIYTLMIITTAKINNKMVYNILDLAEEKETLINKLKIVSLSDPLTGLYNRRFFEEIFQKELSAANRNKYNISVIFIDIDNFKLINDNFGHPYGDEFLIKFSLLLKNIFQRANDTVARLGGDEFALILSNLDYEETMHYCELLKNKFVINNFEKIKDENEKAILHKVSLSIGGLFIPKHEEISKQDANLWADKALYEAKNKGKNRIILKKFPSINENLRLK